LALNGNSTASIWQFLSFTQNVGLQPGDTFTHSWSLCIEEQFYLILPISVLLIAATSKSIRVGWLALSVAILSGMTIRGFEWFWHGGSAISSMHFYEHIYYSSFARFDELLPGVALAMFKNFNTRAYEKTLRHGNALMVGGMIAVAAMFYLMSHKLETEHGFNFWLTTFGYSFMALSFGLLTLSALSPYSLLNQIKVPGAANLALWSYALYLAHKPIFKVAIDPVHRLGISTDSISGIAIIMVSSLLGGWLLFQLVETPFMRLRERLYPSGNINPQKMIENADAMQNS
jgi:peptidoglycan/LPS O-acetylase OafA/YrhL